MAQKIKRKELINTELANTYGGWIYCGECKQTIGYLCYVTYNRIKLEYTCKCGNRGAIILESEDFIFNETSDKSLTIIKNRLCCPEDQSPLITVLSKKLNSYSCEVVCKGCNKKYMKEEKSE